MKSIKSIKRILDRINFHLPKDAHVSKIRDASASLDFDITPSDINRAVCANPSKCMNANAVARTTGKHALFFRATAYVIEGDYAIRYRFGPGVREVVWINDHKGQLEPRKGCLLLPPSCNTRRKQLSQKQIIVRELRSAGKKGIPKKSLMRRFPQIGARITELQDAGFKIISKYVGTDDWVTFVLISEPKEPLKIAKLVSGKRYRRAFRDKSIRQAA